MRMTVRWLILTHVIVSSAIRAGVVIGALLGVLWMMGMMG